MPVEAFAAFENMSDEDKQKDTEAWVKWMEEHKDSFVDMGNPVAENKRVTNNGVSDEKNEVGGYSIIQAENYEAACAMFVDSPHNKEVGAYVEVMEITDIG